jgi:Restriction endonuclease
MMAGRGHKSDQVSNLATGFEAGLSGDEQIRTALQAIVDNGGVATTASIYDAVEKRMAPVRLSDQGRASLRFFVNRVAVQAGYVHPHDKQNPGWRITPEGREYLRAAPPPAEEVQNLDTDSIEQAPSNAARGAAFERYVLTLLKQLYPHYTWFHQGERKSLERGLDFIGSRIGERTDGPAAVGVQVKFHSPNAAPSQTEWLKFLAGCFARRIDQTIFVTTGRLTSEQRREAGEANVLVIEGRDEIARIAKLHNVGLFNLFESGNDPPTQDE